MAQKVVYSLGADAKQLASTLDALKVKATELQTALASISSTLKSAGGKGAARELTDAEKAYKSRKDALKIQRLELAELKLQRSIEKEMDRLRRDRIRNEERLQAEIRKTGKELDRVWNDQQKRAAAERSRAQGLAELSRRNAPAMTQLTPAQEKSIRRHYENQARKSGRSEPVPSAPSGFQFDRPPTVSGRNKSLKAIAEEQSARITKEMNEGFAAIVRRGAPTTAELDKAWREQEGRARGMAELSRRNAPTSIQLTPAQEKSIERYYRNQARISGAPMIGDDAGLPMNQRSLPPTPSRGAKTLRQIVSERITGGPVNFGNFFGEINKASILQSREEDVAARKSEANQKKVQRELKKTETAAARARKQFLSTFSDNAVSRFAGRVRDITSALILFNALRGIVSTFQQGRDFIMQTNQGIENARVGIASTITVAGQYVDTLGKAVSPAQQVALALKEADSLIPQLLEVARTRGLSFDALLQTQTATAGFTKAAGFTPEQTVETIATVAFFSEKLGISQGRIVRTLDNIIKGYRVSQTELGTSLGLDDTIIEQWREQGVLAQELLKLLAGTAEASKKNLENLDGIKNSINATLTILTKQTTSGFFESVKNSYQLILDGLSALKESPESLESIRGLFDAIGKDIESATKSLLSLASSTAARDLARDYEDIKDSLNTVLGTGTVGLLLFKLFSAGKIGAPGLALAGAGGLAALGLRGILPDSAFNKGLDQGDLNRLDSATSAANIARASTLRPGGGGDLDSLITALIVPPPVAKEDAFNFVATQLEGGDGGKGKGGSRGARPPRQLTRQEAFAGPLADERRLREQVLAEELDAIERGNAGMSDRVRIAESELRVIDAKGGSIADQLAKQNEINDLKRKELDLEIKILETKARRIEDELPRVGDDDFPGLNDRLLSIQEELNSKKADQVVLENEIAAAAKATVKERSKEAETLSDIVKGLRDGVKITDLLMGIGRQAGDKMIDNFVDTILGEGKTGSSASGGSGGGGLFGSLSSMFGGSGNAPAAGQTGPPAPSIANGGSSLGALGSGASAVISGASMGAGFASFGGLFGASEQEQKAGMIGGASGGAIGAGIGFAIGGPVGAAIGSALGGLAGTLGGFLAEALGIIKGPTTDRVIRRRLGEAIESSGLPSLRGKPGQGLSAGVLGESALARFLTLDESGREIKLGRGGFNAQQSAGDVLAAIGVSTTGLSERDKQAALSRVLGTASGGLDEGLDRLSGRRTERLSNISDRVNRAQTTGDMIRSLGGTSDITSIKIGNETVPLDPASLAQYREQAIRETNATFRAELTDFIEGLDEIPAAVDGATLAFNALGTDGVLNLERLKDSIADTSALIESGFTNGIKALAEGSSIRDAVQAVDEAYQDIANDRFTQRFIDERKLDPNFTKAVDLTNQAIDAYMAGDTVTAARLFNEAQGARSASNNTAAREFAEMSPFLRMINTDTIGNGGVQLPMFMQPNGGVDTGARTIELLEEQNYLLRNGGGQSGSVATVTNNTSVSISSREISDAERNAYQRQSSGTRRPNPNVGVRQ